MGEKGAPFVWGSDTGVYGPVDIEVDSSGCLKIHGGSGLRRSFSNPNEKK